MPQIKEGECWLIEHSGVTLVHSGYSQACIDQQEKRIAELERQRDAFVSACALAKEALIVTHPDAKVLREALESGFVARMLERLGGVFDDKGRAAALLALTEAIAMAQVEKCGFCGGTGEVDSGALGSQGYPINVPCPECDGTGNTRNRKEATDG